MFQNILVATDDLPPVRHGLRYTATLFPRSRFHLLSVVDTSDKTVPMSDMVREELKNTAQKAVDSGKHLLKEMGVTSVKTSITEGVPSKEILRYAKENQIELLVTAKTGKECHACLGSTCLHVLEKTHCPVIVVPIDVPLKKPRLILNPTSGSHYSTSASELAVVIADHFQAELHALYMGKHHPKPALRNIESKAQKLDVVFKGREIKGNLEREILAWSDKHDIMVFSRGSPSLRYKIRKVNKKAAMGRLEREVLAESRIPVVIVGD